jgi:hypothetical protein
MPRDGNEQLEACVDACGFCGCPAPGTHIVHTASFLFRLRKGQAEFHAFLVTEPGHRPNRPREDLALILGIVSDKDRRVTSSPILLRTAELRFTRALKAPSPFH